MSFIMEKAHTRKPSEKKILPAGDDPIFLFLKNSHDLFVSLSSDLKILTFNPATEKIYQKNVKFCSGHSYRELFDNDEVIFKLLENKKDLFLDLNKQYPSPLSQTTSVQNTCILWTIYATKDNTDQMTGITMIGYNLSNEKTAEQKWRDTVSSLESMIAHLPGNVYWMDKNCVHIGCNNNVLNMLGLTRKEYIGKTYEELAKIVNWKDGQGESFKRDDMEVLRTGKPKFNVEELPLPHQDGRVLHYLTSRVPMRNEAGEIVGVAGISIDITDRKKMEEELKEAKEKAELAADVKAKFLANMSHDFITPLSIITGASEALAAYGNKTNKRLEYCHDIKITANMLMGYVKDILEVAQFDYEKVPLKKEIFDLHAMAYEVIRIFALQADKKGIYLGMDYPEHVVYHIVSDKHRIRRILNNLLGNAIKFTESGGRVDLKIDMIDHNADTARICFIVSDTGIGIPEDKLELIFDRFSRLDPSYSGHYQGLGLGLNIVREFAQQLDGCVTVKSKIGQGSVFRCEVVCNLPNAKRFHSGIHEENNLQRKKEIKNQPVQKASLRDSQQPPSTELSIKKLLLVEDEPLIQKFTQLALKDLGCQITIANNAQEAISFATNNVYDLILLDMGLPDHDGLYVAKKIRTDEANHTKEPQRIIVLTAHLDSSKKEACFKAGVNDFLKKPLTKEMFLQLYENSKPSLRKKLPKNKEIPALEAKNSNIIDWDLAIKTMGGNSKLAKDIILSFIKQLPHDIKELNKLYQAKSYKKLGQGVHKMRGAALYCGMPLIWDALSQLEKALQQSKPTKEIDTLYEKVNELFSRLFEENSNRFCQN